MNALDLHKQLIVIDGHCDTVDDLVGVSFTAPDSPPRDFLVRGRGHIDLPRLVEGGTTCQFMAMFVDDDYMADPREHTYRLLEALEATYKRTSDFRPATKAAHIEAAKSGGYVASLMTIEGGEAIGESIDELRAFYDRGVRLMTLTWNRRNAIGRGAGTGDPKVDGTGGLTDFGRKVVAEMERIGMIVDVSHLADETFEEVMALVRRPVVASHSNSRELCGHRRNLTDAMAERIAATGGLIACTFAGIFVDKDPAKVSVGRFLDHVDRLVSVVGAEHVGIGSDFDGFSEKFGVVLKDCSRTVELTSGLLERGYSEDDARKIMGGNWLRVVREICG
jgi:Zn-dependent dipeptidase, microsomal dipeptidase homolog